MKKRKTMEFDQKRNEEKDGCDVSQLRPHTVKWVASVEMDKHRRECSSLKEMVTRLKESRMRDEEIIKVLRVEIERKESEFTEYIVELETEIRGLDCSKKKAKDEVDELKNKFVQLSEDNSRFCGENRRLKGKKIVKEREHVELEARTLKLVVDTFHLVQKTTATESDEKQKEIFG